MNLGSQWKCLQMQEASIVKQVIFVKLLALWHKVWETHSYLSLPIIKPRVAHNQIAHIDFGKPAHSYSDTIQGFHRFLLDQLSSEGNSFPHNPLIVPLENISPSMIAAPITQLLGLDAKTNIYCSSCKGRRQKENMTHVIDLIFPKSVCLHSLRSIRIDNLSWHSKGY